MLFPIFYRVSAGVAGALSNGIEMASQNYEIFINASSSRKSSSTQETSVESFEYGIIMNHDGKRMDIYVSARVTVETKCSLGLTVLTTVFSG